MFNAIIIIIYRNHILYLAGITLVQIQEAEFYIIQDALFRNVLFLSFILSFENKAGILIYT